MTRGKRWSEAEVASIIENYPLHGRSWDGWERLLPGRSPESISLKAHKLGLRMIPWKSVRKRIDGRAVRRGPWTPEMDRAAVSAIYLLARAVRRSAVECALRIIELEEARSAGANGLETGAACEDGMGAG